MPGSSSLLTLLLLALLVLPTLLSLNFIGVFIFQPMFRSLAFLPSENNWFLIL